jgi:hypothetical protein
MWHSQTLPHRMRILHAMNLGCAFFPRTLSLIRIELCQEVPRHRPKESFSIALFVKLERPNQE